MLRHIGVSVKQISLILLGIAVAGSVVGKIT
jgi:hypothetical protein